MNNTQKTAEFSFGKVLDNAWKQVKGNKWCFWQAGIIWGIVATLVFGIHSVLSTRAGLNDMPYAFKTLAWEMVTEVIYSFLAAPLIAGITVWTLKKVRRQSCVKGETMRHTRLWLSCFGVLAIQSLITWGVSLALVLTSLPYAHNYLYSAIQVAIELFLYFNVIILVDKKCTPWKATVLSFSLVAKNFLKALLLFIVLTLVIFFGTLLLGIGLIWALPFTFLALVEFYVVVSGENNNKVDLKS